jgi:hypothetical protein
MGARLMTHRGRSVVTPPRELVEPHVERTPNHWYWLLEFFDDGLDRTAVFPWSPPAEHQVQFVVARLLWCWENDGLQIKNLKLENTCGLATCINPDHWRYINNPISITYTLPAGVGARLVQYTSKAGSVRYVQGSVHIAHDDTSYTVCGVALRPLASTKLGVVITCKTCVAEWRALGRPLLEVKPP